MDVEKNKEQKPSPKIKKAEKNIQTQHKYWIGGYSILAVASLVIYFLLRLNVFELLGSYRTLISKLCLAAFISFIVLIASKLVEMLVIKQSHVKALRYNLVRLVRLVSMVVIFLIFVSFIFANWYTAAVSLGLFSLILGFALQTPISSFIGWLYIIFRAPYHVGDRIQISDFTGDVVEINYLDTTLWEFRGDYLTNDLPSGRLIRFPNSMVLSSAVFNYSWKKFPFIWNEIPFHVAYESDLQFVEDTLREVTKNELDKETAERIDDLKELVKQTPIDELEIKEYPYISFRTNANTWMEVTVTYLVAPKKASATRSRILKGAIAALLKQPDKAMFPKSNAR